MFDQYEFAVVELQMLADEFAQIGRHRFAAFHMDHVAAAAALEQRFELACEVFCLFFKLHIAVAQNAEQAAAVDGVAGKEPVDMKQDQIFERHKARGLVRAGQTPEPFQLRRHRQKRHYMFAVLSRELEREREA
ncbi:MAG: hypothetical protein WDM89_15350 [Rhizomicrobium sp.]